MINYSNICCNNNLFANYPKRHPLNYDLSLCYQNSHRNIYINVNKGPIIIEYMDTLIETFLKQQNDYSRVYAVMVNLSFPKHWPEAKRIGEDFYSKFMDSLNGRIRHFNNLKKKVGQSRSSRVRFCRVIEDGQTRCEFGDPKGLHIHTVLFFNGHQFNRLGDLTSGNVNLGFRIESAWASALRLDVAEVRRQGLVDFSKNARGYLIDSNMPNKNAKAQEMFYHFSYICKAFSKRYDLNIKTFSCSRV